jgi:hypothetical protein
MALFDDPGRAIGGGFLTAQQRRNGAGEGCAIDGVPLIEINQRRTPSRAPLNPSWGQLNGANEGEYKGQIYRFMGAFDHTRRDGRVVPLRHWETECAECGATFTLKTAGSREPNRRCPGHRKPGVRV